jgi:hypothetical protein
MSLGIAFKGPEGIVLAADSRVTLMGQIPGQPIVIPATYDNASKLLRIDNYQTHVGAITYGVGALGQQEFRTAHSLMPEFEDYLKEKKVDKRLGVEDFAKHLSDFFLNQWTSRMSPPVPNVQTMDMAFIVGGYDENEAYGKVFEFYIPSRPIPRETIPGATFGLTWGGQREYVDRLLNGFDDNLLMLTQQSLGLNDTQRENLRQHLAKSLSAPIPYQFLPLQDCVNLSVFLIRTTIGIQSCFTGLRGVGGSIDVATITRKKGFDTIKEKHIIGG